MAHNAAVRSTHFEIVFIVVVSCLSAGKCARRYTSRAPGGGVDVRGNLPTSQGNPPVIKAELAA
jgi:hypothetical protein